MIWGEPGNGRGFINLKRLKLKNPNGFILGSAGYGVSHFARKEILSAFYGNKRNRIFIIDTWGEYRDWVKELGGEVVCVTAISDIRFSESSRLVCFDLGGLISDWIKIALINALDCVWNHLREEYEGDFHDYVYIDDVALAFKDNMSSKYIKDIFVQSRMKGLVLTLISKSPQEMLLSENGKKLLANSELVVLLNQTEIIATEMSELFQLSPKQKRFITEGRCGDGLILAGSKTMAINAFCSEAAS